MLADHLPSVSPKELECEYIFGRTKGTKKYIRAQGVAGILFIRFLTVGNSFQQISVAKLVKDQPSCIY